MPSLYTVTIPVFVRALGNLDHLLDKAIASGIDEAALTGARLIDDMLPFPRQVQSACDTAKFAAERIAALPPRGFADTETTLAELRLRVAATIAYIDAVDPAAFDGRDEAEVVLKLPNGERRFTATGYATDFALPNFFFHVTMAYALLRMKGVKLGKLDYLAGAAASV